MAPDAAHAQETMSLARVVWHVQRMFGAAWYYAPGRWRTGDGYAPFAAVVHAYRASIAHEARGRLSLVRAIALAMSDPKERGRHLADDARVASGEA